MTDLANWLSWFRRQTDIDIDNEKLIAVYNEYYSCTCESCTQRKTLGMMPVRQTTGCTTPLTHLSVEETHRRPELISSPQE